MANATVIKLTNNGGTTLLPISDSAYIQHRWATGWDPTSSQTVQNITSVQDALNDTIDRVDNLSGSSHSVQALSYTAGTGIVLSNGGDSINGGGTVQVEGSELIKITGTNNKMVISTTANNYSHPTNGANKTVGPKAGKPLAHGDSFVVPGFTVNNFGHVTSATDYTYTLPSQYEHPTNGANKSVQQNAGGTLSEGKSFKVAKLTINNLGHVTSATDMTYTMPSTFTPSSHAHGNINNSGELTNASMVVVTDANKKITTSSNITTTELGYLDGVTSNIQDQINTLSSTIASGMHMRGTTTTVPGASTAYIDGDSYVCNGVITIPVGQSVTGAAQTTEKGDMITYIGSQKKWAVIQNNIGDYVSSIKGTGDSWISVTPTTATSGAVTIGVTHSGPSVTGATVGPAGNKTLDLAGSKFTVPKLTFDSHGHITAASNITYTMPTHSTPQHYNLLFNNNAGTTVDTYKPTTSPDKTLKAGTDLEITASSNVITITHSGTGRNKTSGLYKITTDARGHVIATAVPSTGSVSTTVGMKYVELKTDADDLNATWLGTIGTGTTTTQLLSSATGTFVTT